MMPENEKGVLWVLTVSDNSLAELIDIIDALSQKKFNIFFALFCTGWTEMDNGIGVPKNGSRFPVQLPGIVLQARDPWFRLETSVAPPGTGKAKLRDPTGSE